MTKVVILIMITITISCTPTIQWKEVWPPIQEEISRLPSPNAVNFRQFAQDWKNLQQHPQWSIETLTYEQADIVIQAVARYQLYYFMEPDIEYKNKLAQLWMIWSACVNKYPALQQKYQEAQQLRMILQAVQQRNEQAQSILPELLQYWEKNPQQWQELLSSLIQPWEIGGIVYKRKNQHTETKTANQNDTETKTANQNDTKLETTNQETLFNAQTGAIEVVEIKDTQQAQNAQYLAEFRQNNFRHLDILEQRFIQRLQLFDVDADPSTTLYVQVAIKGSQQRFALLRTLARKKSWNEEDLEMIKKAKKKLYFFGLEKRLLYRTYFLDKQSYILNPEVCFFFHSHPYDEKIPYLKLPSKQDQIATFRIGPCLVFDIQQNFIDLYCIIAGEVEKIQRFPYELPD